MMYEELASDLVGKFEDRVINGTVDTDLQKEMQTRAGDYVTLTFGDLSGEEFERVQRAVTEYADEFAGNLRGLLFSMEDAQVMPDTRIRAVDEALCSFFDVMETMAHAEACITHE